MGFAGGDGDGGAGALAFAGHCGEARGVGLIGAVELAADKEKRQPFDAALKMGPRLAEAAQQEGLIVRSVPGDAIAFCPPLIITEDQIDELFDRFTRALDRFTQETAKEAAE